eukprot:13313161-Heterocapsa_arctica.AAC.1
MSSVSAEQRATATFELIAQLVQPSRVITKAEQRAVRIIVPWIEKTCLQKATKLIRHSPDAAVL